MAAKRAAWHGTLNGYNVRLCRCPACCKVKSTEDEAKQADYSRWLAVVKNKPCADCGGSFPAVCMDYVYKYLFWRSFDIETAAHKRRAYVLDEVAKCDLVCANCHRLRDASQHLPSPSPSGVS